MANGKRVFRLESDPCIGDAVSYEQIIDVDEGSLLQVWDDEAEHLCRRIVKVTVDADEGSGIVELRSRQRIVIETLVDVDLVHIDSMICDHPREFIFRRAQASFLPLSAIVRWKSFEAVEGVEMHLIHVLPPGLGQSHAGGPSTVAAEFVVVAFDAVLLQIVEGELVKSVLFVLPHCLVIGYLVVSFPVVQVISSAKIHPWFPFHTVSL